MLNGNHQSALRNTFQVVDASLVDVLSTLDPSRPPSPFATVVADATPTQHRVAAEHVRRIRDGMRDALQAFGVPLPAPQRSAVWTARTALMMSHIALEEVEPSRLRGYGELTEEDAKDVGARLSHIESLLERFQQYLAEGPGADLQQRVERLESAGSESGLLRKLERVITEQGLIEFRRPLETLLARVEDNRLEVALFGRVSSGKTSLLNEILQVHVLPVGVTPVTATPVRIVYGAEPRAKVRFAERPSLVISCDRLAEFASEEHNPGNAKHVTSIVVELPSPRLGMGIALVDTPGVGSLAESGAAEALAYLPRCDLGIVLVDAASTLVAEDVALVELLLRSGASAQVLLSKADLLSDADRRQSLDYLKRQLSFELSADIPVFAVSVRGQSAPLGDAWIRESLLPALASHRTLAAQSVRRKIGRLRAQVAEALRTRDAAAGDPQRRAAWLRADAELLETGHRLARRLRTFHEKLTPVAKVVDEFLDDASQRLVAQWSRGSATDHDARPELARSLAASASNMAHERVSVVEEARQIAEHALTLAFQAAGPEPPDEPLVDVRDLPVFETPPTLFAIEIRRTWQRYLSEAGFAASIRKQLERAIRDALPELLLQYQRRLDSWCETRLRQLHAEFVSRGDQVRIAAAGSAGEDLQANGRSQRDVQDIKSMASARS